MRLSMRALLSTALLFLCQHASAQNWYDNEKRSCEFASPAALGLPFALKKTTVGGYYFSASKADLNQVLSSPGGVVRVSNPLSAQTVATFKADVDKLRTHPQAASVVLALGDQVSDFSGLWGLASGGLMQWLSSIADARLNSVDRFLDFITVGGMSGHEVAFRSAPAGFSPLLYVTSTYQVQVGAELRPRTWLLSACLLPVEIVLNEVVTTAPGPHANNKRYTRQANGLWRVWDITDQKYDSPEYVYTHQDQMYAYFYERADPSYRTRIHLYGGPVQRLRPGAAWATLYPTNESK